MPRKKTGKRYKRQAFPESHLPPSDAKLPSVEANAEHSDSGNSADHREQEQQMAPILAASGFSLWMQTWLPIIFSGLVVVVIVIQAYIYHQQRNVMKEQRTIMDKQLQTMNDTLRDTIVGQRAYVAIKEIHLSQPLSEADKVDFRTTFENEGNTPAVNVRIYLNWRLLQNEPTAFENVASDKPPNQAIMLPKVPFHMVNTFLSDARERPLWIAEGYNLYLWGTVDYEDVFKEQHRTRFCLRTFSMTDVAVGPCTKNNYFEY